MIEVFLFIIGVAVIAWSVYKMRDYDGEYYHILCFFAGILIILSPVFILDYKKQKELMNECMDDGHKEYECVSMLKRNNNSTTFIPMVIK